MTMTTLTLQQEQENTAETDFYADDGNDQPAHTAETSRRPSWTTPRTTFRDLSGPVSANSSEGEFVVRDEFGVARPGGTDASPYYGNPNAL